MLAPLQQPPTPLNSAFYIGTVFHKRFGATEHQFNYPLYMALLDLDEIDQLHADRWWFSARRWAPLQFKASDYFKTATNIQSQATNAGQLKQSALTIAQDLGANVNGINHVLMLAQLRCFGFYFSPVNFFFLYEGSHCKYLLAEVSNTPWNKKHCYLIDVDKPTDTPKAFHVSPFMNLDMDYKWTVRAPLKSTYIRIENWNKERLFTAQFSAQRHEINAKNIRKIFFKWPAVTGTIVKAIYWQACKLFFKGVAYVPYQNTPKPSHTDQQKEP